MGIPTRLDRPTITAFFPSISMPLPSSRRSRSSMHPWGVQGMLKGMDVKSFQFSLTAPAWVDVEQSLAVLAGCSPSTSYLILIDQDRFL